MRKVSDVAANLALCETLGGHRLLRATHPFAKDAVLHPFSAREYVPVATYLSVQVDDGRHIHLSPEFLQYINHSCDPNTFFDVKKGEIVCLRDIAAGEEITFFYPSTEWSMAQPFDCFCQTGRCLGKIQGAAYLDTDLIAQYQFAGHILDKLALACPG